MDPTKMLVFDLRRELRQRNLDSSGKKVFLVSRLQFVLDEEKRMAESGEIGADSHENNGDNESELNNDNPNRLQHEIRAHSTNNQVVEIQTNQSENCLPVDNNQIVEIQTNQHIMLSPDNHMNLQNQSEIISPVNNELFVSNEVVIEFEEKKTDGDNRHIQFDDDKHNMVEASPSESCTVSQSTENGELCDFVCEQRAQSSNTQTEIFLNVEKMCGKRKGSEIFYCKNEDQFYIKKRKLANGTISAVCRHKDCNKRIYIDEATNTATSDSPNVVHEHSPQKKTYEEMKMVNRMKAECANLDKIAKNETKTSIIKAIFTEEVQK